MLAALPGCEKRIDGPDSIPKVAASLPADKKTAFENSVLYLTVGQAFENGKPVDIATLTGKTADEVIALAERTRSDLKAKAELARVEKAKAELAELQEKQRKAADARTFLDKFVVERAQAKVNRGGYITEPVIEMIVHNTTDKAISRAFFRAVYATPGRQVPWVDDTFNYTISGGLEPSERATWSLAPNQFTDIGKAVLEQPSGAVLTLTVTRLDGPGGETLANGAGLSKDEAKRLEELIREYGMPKPR